MKFEEIKNKLNKCLEKLYVEDKFLFSYETKDSRVSERCLTYRLGYYMQDEFKEYNVDSEYNRHIKDNKYLNNRNIYPDLIIHTRGNDNFNLLWIEIKKYATQCNEDIKRLKKVTSNAYEYQYKFGVMVVLEKNSPIVTYYSNGQEIK